VSFPGTPAGRQARWLVGALAHLPIPAAQIRAHFDQGSLAHVPAPATAALNASFAGLRRLRVDSIAASTADAVELIVTVNGTRKHDAEIEVDPHGLISLLHAGAVGGAPAPPPTTTTTTTTPPACGRCPSAWDRRR